MKHPIVVSMLLLFAVDAAAQQRDLVDLSLQDLMNVEITSVSFKPQPLSRTAAAVYVITTTDIERSGATTLPDLLRMVPGFNVAQISATAWSVTSRGFGGLYANKLLVLIDGRSVYSEVSGGVNWGMQFPPLYLVKQIEVIRGPGGSMWGANAVNGVINIITKSADDLQGTAVTAHSGRYEPGIIDVSNGGAIAGRVRYVASGRYFQRRSPALTGSLAGSDRAEAVEARTRIDWSAGRTQRFWLAAAGGRTGQTQDNSFPSAVPPYAETIRAVFTPHVAHVTLSWSATPSGGVENSVLAYYSSATNGFPFVAGSERTADVKGWQRRSIGRHHEIVAGAEYRNTAIAVTNIPTLRFNRQHARQHDLTGYVQDEIMVSRKLSVTPGIKTENDVSGFEALPSLRAVWNPTPRQAIWASVSHGMRRPHLFEQDIRWVSAIVPVQGSLPLAMMIEGNPDAHSEILNEVEGGYRAKAGTLTVDVSAFGGRYHDLLTAEPSAPALGQELGLDVVRISRRLVNASSAKVDGGETSATWTPGSRVQFGAGYSFVTLTSAPGAAEASDLARAHTSVPRQQWNARALFDVPGGADISAFFFHAGPIPAQRVASYNRLDLRLAHRIAGAARLVVGARNLFRKPGIEYVDISGAVSIPARPDAYAEIAWMF
jgi:iron complex outermembrane recepter protein